MKRGHLIAAILTAVAAAAMGLTLVGPSSASARTGAEKQPAAATQHVVVINCLGGSQVKPREFVLTCADGYTYLSNLAWTSWTPAMASATGSLVENDCVPSCVGGHFHTYPVRAALWGPVAYHHGKRFSQITMIFPGHRPPVFNGHRWVPGPVTITDPLWS